MNKKQKAKFYSLANGLSDLDKDCLWNWIQLQVIDARLEENRECQNILTNQLENE